MCVVCECVLFTFRERRRAENPDAMMEDEPDPVPCITKVRVHCTYGMEWAASMLPPTPHAIKRD